MLSLATVRKCSWIRWLVFLLSSFLENSSGKLLHEASFYGESYVFNPLNDASSSTWISLEFRTNLPHGLLFLAAGNTDYVIIQLNGGVMETRVNLGSGEAVAFSARGVRLDNLQWHSLVLNRTQDSVYLEVDGAGQGQATTPGSYHELNIDLGIVLGGNGNLKKELESKPFRGCLRNVYFNGRNIIEEVKALKSSQQNVLQVSWKCDDEFGITSFMPLSFNHENSFIAFPHLRVSSETRGAFSCELKTRSPNAVVLFNSGVGSTSDDFISVELIDGKPKLSIDKGSGIIEVILETPINDGRWHKLEMSVTQTSAQLKSDMESNTTRFHLGSQNNLNLGSHLFIGGVGAKARAHAVKLGLATLKGSLSDKGSMLGCIRNIIVNSRNYGFQHIQISHLISPECSWEFPCSKDPCVPSGRCVELEGSDFRCDCREQSCVKEEFLAIHEDKTKQLNGIMSVDRLEVKEGGYVALSTNAIKINRDFLREAVRDENIVFIVKEPPKEGILETRGRGAQKSFTLKDLKENSVYYRHQGGAARMDSMTLEVALSSLVKALDSFQERYDFVLPVRITPQSVKKLVISLKSGHLLSISAGSIIRITQSILDVKSADNDASSLIFSVMFLRQASSSFERSDDPRKSIASFTLKDIYDGKIWFRHQEDTTVYTKVNVTNGVDISDAVDLRFKVEELRLKVQNNTGIFLSYGSSSLITAHNLSTIPNLSLEELDIRYNITQPTVHGALQRMEYGSSEWIPVTYFSQRHINSGRLRYVHQPGKSISMQDSFKFEVICKHLKTQPQTFSITLKTVTLSVEQNSNMILNHVSYGRFTNKTLMVVSNTENLNMNNIIYLIVRPPQYGSIYLIKQNAQNPIMFEQFSPLQIDNTFTQNDINEGFIYYKFEKPGFDQTDDFVDLQASYFGFPLMVRTSFQYSPDKVAPRFINNGLKDVPEGGSAVITKQNLSLDLDKFKKFMFSIIRGPAHGTVNIRDPNSSAILKKNVSFFTMSDIKELKVVYIHDDSENQKDSFTFSANPVLEDSEGNVNEFQEFSGVFHIMMKMKNDNPPVQAVNKVFHVAVGQTKHLTTADLAFTDPDTDFDDSLLTYQRQIISNGDILNSLTEEPVYNFTQSDLAKGLLLFHHKGDKNAQVPISVSDGKFFTNTLFEIQASPPYILIVNNTGVEVQQGSHTTINGFNLSIESNFNFSPEDVTFQITEEPKHGLLRINGRQVLKFTLLELLNSRVRYWHNSGPATEDKLTLSVNLDPVQTQVVFKIKIVAEGLSDPPEIIHNQILKVQALQSEIITENLLKVAHRNYPPNEIEFIITQLPRFGHLMIKGTPVKTGNVPEFTQQDITDRLISYVSQSQDSTSDKFVFDVGTEFQSLRQLEFLIENIPQTQMVNRVNITVAEGAMVTITSQLLPLRGRLAQNGKPVFTVIQAPVHGQILLKNGKKGTQVSSFTLEDVGRGRVAYAHDGSESLSDEFVVKAEAQDAAVPSQQTILKVSVTPVDDQPPRIVVNTGLDLWTGSLSLLTNQHLQASDADTSSAMVEFRVLSPPSNGHLAFLNNTFKQISKFTQQDLDSKRIVFVHKGSEMGEFTFQATDGSSKDEPRVFKLRARPVQLTLAVSDTIRAFPGILQPITNVSLLAKTSSSNYTHPIVFTILEPRPRKGKLVSKVNKMTEINSFTQMDINEGMIFFQPYGSMRNWAETDQIFFEITAAYAQMLSNQTLKVDISYSNINEGNYQTLLNIKMPKIKEGDKIPISRENFDSVSFVQKIQAFKPDVSVEFSFTSSTNHGYLWFKGKAAEVGEVFTQEELDRGLLTYKHDHTDTVRDRFRFTVKIMIPRSVGEASNSTANTFKFDIFIEPINDMGFEMVTLHPRILVLQGSEVVVTSQDLATVDPDTRPEGIEYTILNQPKNGILVRVPENKTQVVTFTQKDIDDGRLIFKHDGSRESSSSLYFKVWDGMFQPKFSNMDINVTPLFIEVGKNAHVPVIQGSRSVALSNVFLNISTNGDYKALIYKITQAPQFGRLRKLNSPAREFKQADIDSGAITYMQDKDSPGDDFFVCDIALQNIDCSIDTVQIDVVMKPLIKQGPLVTSNGQHVAITRSSLDASELAQITGDNPRFNISVSPKHGKIMRRHRQRRQAILENNFQPVSYFTFEDILYTKIYYVANGGNVNDKTDKFTFWLSAKGVPSAKGELVIHLNNPVLREKDNVDKKPVKDVEKAPDERDVVVTEGDVGEKQPVLDTESNSNDNGNIVIIAIVLSLIFIICIIIVLVVLFLRWRRKNQAALVHETKATKVRPVISGPLQLEQPHVLIEAQKDGMISPNSRDSTALMTGQGEENEYVNTSHMSSTHEALHLLSGSSSGSPDITRVEISHSTSGLKTTPTHDSQSEQASEEIERCSTVTSGRGSNASNDLMDWTLMDPDLLQHCRTTTPVLRNNQYWL